MNLLLVNLVNSSWVFICPSITFCFLMWVRSVCMRSELFCRVLSWTPKLKCCTSKTSTNYPSQWLFIRVCIVLGKNGFVGIRFLSGFINTWATCLERALLSVEASAGDSQTSPLSPSFLGLDQDILLFPGPAVLAACSCYCLLLDNSPSPGRLIIWASLLPLLSLESLIPLLAMSGLNCSLAVNETWWQRGEFSFLLLPAAADPREQVRPLTSSEERKQPVSSGS